MNISALLSALKVIDEVMKLLNDIEVRMYIIIIHTIYISNLLYDDYAGILEYSVSSAIVDWQLVYVVFTQSMPWSTLHL